MVKTAKANVTAKKKIVEKAKAAKPGAKTKDKSKVVMKDRAHAAVAKKKVSTVETPPRKVAKAAAPEAPVKVKGKPGRKPKAQADALLQGGVDAVPEARDDTVDPGVQVAEKLGVKKSTK